MKNHISKYYSGPFFTYKNDRFKINTSLTCTPGFSKGSLGWGSSWPKRPTLARRQCGQFKTPGGGAVGVALGFFKNINGNFKFFNKTNEIKVFMIKNGQNG